ncbi:MAG: hypothetical protein K9N46_15325 [Candidatus Marinimicrobia bacterium]|nr:hypothetical protein [Candidatus Neomarinimicrobiota bacterium]MCF7830165.1 hypothetical protein [Candidatus Neomarinimicrobiota bacterium]MCF7882101.1 hypothetical protein [Candidatus Neomarinimicrobiota bacterium]
MDIKSSYDLLIGLLVVCGVLFTFFPKAMIKLNQIGNIVLFSDEDILKHPKAMGIILIFIGIVIFVDLLVFL